METLTIELSIEDLQVNPETGKIIIHIDGNTINGESKAFPNRHSSTYGRKYKRSRLSIFMEDLIDDMQRKGKTRTAEAYQTTLNSFMKFRKQEDVYVYEIKATLMEKYQTWLKKKGLSMNSISFYMRILRSVYNHAVEYNLTTDNHPFRKVYTGIAKTVKRSVSLDIMRQIINFKTDDPGIEFARDMFLFSFYTRGMSFVDMSYLKKTDIKGDSLVYSRKKTGQEIVIKWTRELQALVEKHPSATNTYLLPIIRKENGKERNQKRYRQNIVNENLKKLSECLNLEHPITMYAARHSWASLARYEGIPVKTISNALGHESEKTTLIYLKELDTTAADRANRQLIDLVNGKEE
ncbi:MAG: site-specific integrase [Prevotella sp.]|nr:site-specific integrase [Prevotella sp.]